MSQIDRIDGGMDTTRLTATEQDQIARAQREADALAYLTRTNNLDLAPVLGLVESPKPKRQPRKRVGGSRRTTKES